MIFYSIYMYAIARYNGIARPSVRLSVRYFDSVLGHFFFAVPIRIYSSDLFTAKLYRGPSDIFFIDQELISYRYSPCCSCSCWN